MIFFIINLIFVVLFAIRIYVLLVAKPISHVRFVSFTIIYPTVISVSGYIMSAGVIISMSCFLDNPSHHIAQSAGAVEYIDCISAEV